MNSKDPENPGGRMLVPSSSKASRRSFLRGAAATLGAGL
jgi:hypothetical protein